MKRIDRCTGSQKAPFKQEQVRRLSYNQKKPKISFEFLYGTHCISQCQLGEKAEVLDTLHRLSQRTWQEIIQLGKTDIGYEHLDVDQIDSPVPRNDLFKSLDKVTVFHRAPKIPLVGFRVEDVFYLFCVDRGYDAYKHPHS